MVTIGFHGILAKKVNPPVCDVNGGACEDSCWFHGTPPGLKLGINDSAAAQRISGVHHAV